MKTLELDARGWGCFEDYYDALLKSLGAPAGHGRNVNALVDSICYGGMNAIDPPFHIRISNCDHLPADVREEIEWTRRAIAGQAEVTWELRSASPRGDKA